MGLGIVVAVVTMPVCGSYGSLCFVVVTAFNYTIYLLSPKVSNSVKSIQRVSCFVMANK